MSTKTDGAARPGLSMLLKNKIGKLYSIHRKVASSSRSKSSPALLAIDPNIIQTSGNKLIKQKPVKEQVPCCQTIIDLSVLKGDALNKAVQSLILTLFKDWNIVNNDLKLDRVSGAMTNSVFFVTTGSTRMLLRVFGAGCEQFLDRDKELDWLGRLSQVHIGPKLLGIFGNGRFEEYLPSTTLTKDDIRQPAISTEIASRLHQLHSIVDTFPPSTTEPLEVWPNIEKWYKLLVTDLLPILSAKNISWQSQIETDLDVVELRNEIELCKLVLSQINSPIVFAHNDTQYGNILKINGTNELVVIDFEYAGYNPRAFDIANHFCEWMYDYHSEEPAKMHINQYPTKEQRSLFLSSYDSNQNLDSFLIEVDHWKMACLLFWGLWGLVQASQSEIDFDYFYYSMQRIAAFRLELQKYLNKRND